MVGDYEIPDSHIEHIKENMEDTELIEMLESKGYKVIKPGEEYKEHTLQTIRKEKPNSFEYGKPGNRVKIYWDDVNELKSKIAEVNEMQMELKNEEDR